MSTIFDFILDKTSRQRFVLLKFFLDNPFREFSRKEIVEKMSEPPYLDILSKGSGDKDDHPFINRNNPDIPPTILRERLDEMVNERILEKGSLGKKIQYQLNRNMKLDIPEEYSISEPDAADFQSWLQSVVKYRELPFADLLDYLIKKSKVSYTSQAVTIVDFETPFLHNEEVRKLVSELYWNIQDCIKIKEIVYTGNYYSKRKPNNVSVKDFMPYVLKESRGQWYLTGKCVGEEEFRSIPVYRIIEKNDYEYHERESQVFKREPFNPEIYWDGCAGITRYGAPMNISIEVKNGITYNNIDYIRSLPLVKGHQEISMKGDWMEVSLKKVFLGPELIRDIRSFGKNNLRNIKPEWLQEDLWEEGSRGDIGFSIKLRPDEDLQKWIFFTEQKLHILSGGENESASLIVQQSPNKPGWHKVSLNHILINSRLYFFIQKLIKEFASNQLNITDKSFLK